MLEVILTCTTDAIITLQFSYMREVLLEASNGLQSDTVEGVVMIHNILVILTSILHPVMIIFKNVPLY